MTETGVNPSHKSGEVKKRMRIRAFACSTQGRVRLNNEDSFTLNTVAGRDPAQYPEQEAQAQPTRHTQWYGVFDGMGGEQCGEAASRAAAATLASRGRLLRLGSVGKRLDGLTRTLNLSVVRALGDAQGGCTMAVAILRGHRLWTTHAGDSRVYLYQARERQMTLLTRDHTLAELLKKGAGRRRSHTLTRYLGGEDVQGVVSGPYRLSPGDRVLICSDGLTDMVSDTCLFARLHSHSSTEDTARALLRDAMERGGRDNATVLLLDVQGKQKGI